MSDNMELYLQKVAEQIRWKRARPILTQELRCHLLDEQDANCAVGMDKIAAETEALRQMGNPIEIGMKLDRVHRPKPQWGLLLLSGGLAAVGSILQCQFTYVPPLPRILLSLCLGFFVLLFGYFFDYTQLPHYTAVLYFSAVLLGILSMTWRQVNGIHYYTRYITSLYPCIYALVLYTLQRFHWHGLLLSLIALLPLLAITLSAPYLLGGILLIATASLLICCSIWDGTYSISRKWLIVFFFVLCAAGILLFLRTPDYILHRLSSALHPEADPTGSGYLACLLRETRTTASLIGHTSHVGTECPTVFIHDMSCLLATVLHFFGWIPFLLLCGILFSILIWALFLCLRQTNRLGRFLATAILLTFSVPLTANLLFNLGITLMSGTAPFLTGRLQTILDMALMGLLLSIFRQEHLPFSPSTSLSSSAKQHRHLKIKIYLE